ncbi:hypothetical protein NUW54_g8243 [Trametes sanguinea]|uniref:Uncharacterized protein n=1 Tax=Trametes sanguinea TaxID=158606 RepID=A0ACC1PI29_9APHY|nr:hypothetical protein NUW54_g8243 [Trametes sanguinea]
MLCYKNGALAREQVRDQYADGHWTRFNELVDARPVGNDGYMGFYFPLPRDHPAQRPGQLLLLHLSLSLPISIRVLCFLGLIVDRLSCDVKLIHALPYIFQLCFLQRVLRQFRLRSLATNEYRPERHPERVRAADCRRASTSSPARHSDAGPGQLDAAEPAISASRASHHAARCTFDFSVIKNSGEPAL